MTIQIPLVRNTETTGPADPPDGERRILIDHPKGTIRYIRQGRECDRADRPLIVLTTRPGSVELRQCPSGRQRWVVTFADRACAEDHPVAYAAHFARTHLDLLAEAVHLLPEGLVEPQPLSSRGAAERDFLQMLLPPIFALPQGVQDTFGGLLAQLAYEIYNAARTEDARNAVRSENERTAELLARFLTLPAGTVLTDRYGLQMIAIISESSSGKRRLQISMGAGKIFRRDIDRDVVEGLCLLTAARATALDPRLFSSHAIMDALRVNRGLDERFPEMR